MKKQKELVLKFTIIDAASSPSFLLLETLKKTHPSPYLVVFSVWCVHVTFHWAVCVCVSMRRVSQSVGRGFMSFGVCDDCLVSWIFWTSSTSPPPSPSTSDTHDNIQVVKMSPHGEKPFGGMLGSARRKKATQGTRSQIRAYTPPPHVKAPLHKFLLIFISFSPKFFLLLL